MKVEKIEIKKELLDIPEGRDRMDFAIIPPMVAMSVREGEILSDSVTAQKVTYMVEQVWTMVDGYKNYLVKVDDRKLFQDLVKITQDMVDKQVFEKTEKLHKDVKLARQQAFEEIKNARWSVSMAIKKLPWYTRLFNNF